jgi:signal transduction histidine kinase
VEHSGIPSSNITGKHLFAAFPDLIERGLNLLYEDALQGQVRLVSQRLHAFLLPMPCELEEGFDRMLQTAHIAPLVREDRIIGTITLINDVSEREARERELRVAREGAEQANRSKDRFIAMLSHDLRVPLNSVMGWVQLLKSRRDKPGLLEQALQSIEQNTMAQLRMIEDLVDSVRISTGRLELDFELSDFGKVVDDACVALKPIAQAKQIHLHCSIPPDCGVAQIDVKRMQQVVWNLISNAVKFTPSGGTVRLRLESGPGKFVLAVSDTGIGLSPDVLPHVFESMWQAQRSGDPKAGLGLGLAIVQRVVQLHGGTVRAESPGLGKGATFIVEIPKARTTRSA